MLVTIVTVLIALLCYISCIDGLSISQYSNGIKQLHHHHMKGFKYCRTKTSLHMADVEITFPNKKKVKVSTGSALKDAAKKAGFSPNYGCEEGKCGSCELKFSGKKIRPCTAKVPNVTTPIVLENP